MFLGIYDSKIKFARADARRLRKQRITETEPGPIVHDFDALLDYVRGRRLRVTKNQQLLPLGSLAEINARLHHPVELGLQRPQQKSYPPIHGLYLLLRASGLTYLDETKTTAYLKVDEALAEEWETLNPTERYGTLLETWLLRGAPEIVGERAHPLQRLPRNFEKWVDFFARIPDEGMRPDTAEENVFDFLRYAPGWHNLGLLAPFGLIKIEHGAPIAGERWQIAGIRRTPFGHALLALLYESCFSDLDWVLELEEEEVVPAGTLQPVLKPYFPAWQRTLPLPQEDGFREGLYVFKVTLRKNLWRRLAIRADSTFDRLAHSIIDAYAFDHDHLYMFEYKSRRGTYRHLYHPYMDEGPWASDVLIGEAPLHLGQMLIFTYDFGDNWQFEVALEEITQPEPDETYPRVLEAQGEPPEQYPRWE